MSDYKMPLQRLTEALTLIMEDDRDMPMLRALILFEVALNPGIRQRDLEQVTGYSNAAVSRNLAALSEWKGLGVPGLNLTMAVPDPVERKANIVFLTNKGRKRVEKALQTAIGKDITVDASSAADYIKRAHTGE